MRRKLLRQSLAKGTGTGTLLSFLAFWELRISFLSVAAQAKALRRARTAVFESTEHVRLAGGRSALIRTDRSGWMTLRSSAEGAPVSYGPIRYRICACLVGRVVQPSAEMLPSEVIAALRTNRCGPPLTR